MTNALATWFANNLGNIMPAELVVFIVSLFPILECRGGLIVAALLGVKMSAAIPICIVGNVLPVPFILLFLKAILEDGQPLITLEDGRKTVELFTAIYRSQRDHMPIRFPLKPEHAGDMDGRI